MAHTCPQSTSPHQNMLLILMILLIYPTVYKPAYLQFKHVCPYWYDTANRVSGSVYSPHILSVPIKKKHTKWTLLTNNPTVYKPTCLQFNSRIRSSWYMISPQLTGPAQIVEEMLKGEMAWTRKIQSWFVYDQFLTCCVFCYIEYLNNFFCSYTKK